jgi:hypothetical protein
MCIERIVRNLAFALAAIAVVGVIGATIEFEPLKYALAH